MTQEVNFSLFKAIQDGGYILYLRHAEPMDNQDILTEKGKKQAEQIGNIFKEQKIPIEYRILTSPARRAKETGELAFREQNIEVYNNLAYIGYLEKDNLPDREQQIKEDLIKTLETLPSDNLNKVLIAHHHIFNDSQNDLPHMGTVILKPKGPGKGYEFVGFISLEQFIEWNNNH